MAGGKFWLGTERKKLIELWPTAPRKEIERALPNRTWTAIECYASTLGLKRPKGPPKKYDYTLQEKKKIETLHRGIRRLKKRRKRDADTIKERAREINRIRRTANMRFWRQKRRKLIPYAGREAIHESL